MQKLNTTNPVVSSKESRVSYESIQNRSLASELFHSNIDLIAILELWDLQSEV